MTSEAKKAAKAKYDAKTAKYYSLKLNQNTDSDLINRLAKEKSVQTYIKTLIRNDIERGAKTMATYETKFDVINDLKKRGFFELADDIIETISNDQAGNHASANNHAASIVRTIRNMENVLSFSATDLLDQATRLYGFVNGLAYSELDVVADVIEDVETLYEIAYQVCHIVISGK